MVFPCKSVCVKCEFQLVLCDQKAIVRIRTDHRKRYKLPKLESHEWVAHCKVCGRHYLINDHREADETATLYPHFHYHTLFAWNRLRRRERRLPPVSLFEVAEFWRENMPELTWEAAMVNAYEFECAEWKVPAERRKSFVWRHAGDDLRKDSLFRRHHELALEIPYLAK